MDAFDFTALSERIERAARQAFIAIHRQHAGEGIYAFALYSDDGAMTVCEAANTAAHLKNAGLEDFSLYKFEPSEWKYEGRGFVYERGDPFEEICDTVRTRVMAIDDEAEFLEFRSGLFETCTGVLKKLCSEGFFKQIAGQDIFVIFSATEYEFERGKLREIVTSLNDNEYRDEYLAWMETWAS